MALRVWLPLNGNIENKGLDTDCKSEGTITYSGGKIGQALYMETASTSNGIYAPKQEKQVFTISLWFKAPGYTGTRRDLCNEGRDYNTFGWRVGLNAKENTLTITGAGSGGTYTQSFVPDTWYHIAFSRDESKNVYIYINGVLVSTKTGTGDLNYSESNGYINIGRFGYGSGNSKLYPYQGYLNDFRYYDECLSPKQIKEISKGLVAHYKLEGVGANKNLLTNSQNTIKPDNADSITWCNNVTSYSKDTQEDCAHLVVPTTGNPNNGIGYVFNTADTTLGLSHNQTITFSCDIKGIVGTDLPYLAIRMNFGSEGTWYDNGKGYVFSKTSTMEGVTENTFKRYSVTYTIPADNSNYDAFKLFLCIHANYGGNFYIKNVKLELGEATSWIPNEADSLYIELGYNKALTTDVSGFGYNGTITGELTFDSDSPRYAGSTKFNGSSYITTTPGSLAWCNFDNLTISAWMKPTVKPGGWTGSIGIQQDGGTNGKVFSISNYAGNFSVHTDNGSGWVTTQSEALPLNQWSHCVATLTDGTNLKMYINGELVKTATINYNTATVLSDTRIAIGVDLPGDDEKYTGSYSDARFYSTALSAEDILKLYEISGIIDNKGNIYSYEFIDTNNIIASDKYFTDHSNFYDTFTRSIVDDSESPSGEAMKLTCTANGTQASRGYYFGNVEPWTTAKTKMVHGHTYELSMFVKMNKEVTNFRMNVECASSQSQTIFSIGTKYKRLVNTFVYNANSTYSAITNYGTIFNVGDEIFIHSPQVQEVDIQYKLNKNGILSHSGLDESSQAKIYKYSTEANNFIEI